MKKLLFLAVSLLMSIGTKAQTDDMDYQFVVKNKDFFGKDISVFNEIRAGSETGEVVWCNTSTAKVSNTGVGHTTLSLNEDLDWGNTAYYVTTTIDGKYIGASPIRTIPVSMYAKKAKYVEGVLTLKELIGKWEYVTEKNSDFFYCCPIKNNKEITKK